MLRRTPQPRAVVRLRIAAPRRAPPVRLLRSARAAGTNGGKVRACGRGRRLARGWR
jgi:hypothetical protein